MNTKSITTLVIVIIVIIGGLYALSALNWFTIPLAPFANNEQQTEVETEDEITAPVSGTGTLRAVLAKKGNYTCTVELVDDTVKSSSTIYSSNGVIREEFRSTDIASGKNTDTHIIRSGGMTYIWVGGSMQGIKKPVSAVGGPSTPALSGGGFLDNEDSTVAWNCNPWLPDPKMLTVPTDVTFDLQ